MNKHDKAIKYFEEAIQESDEIIADCSPALQAELNKQKQHFTLALSALREQALQAKEKSREETVISAASVIVRACEKIDVSKPVKVVLRNLFETDEDRCVICGEYVPEGRMVCPVCEDDPYHAFRKKGGKS